MMRLALFLALTLIGGTGVSAEPSARPEQIPPSSAGLPMTVILSSGHSLRVSSGVALLRGPDGTALAQNSRVVRRPDADEGCPSDGFLGAERAGDGFLLRNQLCSGWFFIDEVMTFSRADDGYVLNCFSAAYTDRRTGEPKGPPRVLTNANFGTLGFTDLDPDDLYPLFD